MLQILMRSVLLHVNDAKPVCWASSGLVREDSAAMLRPDSGFHCV